MSKLSVQKNRDTYNPKTVCEGWDSNPLTPTRPDLKSGAFDRAGNRYFVAISKSGFTKKAEEFVKENDFLLFILNDF